MHNKNNNNDDYDDDDDDDDQPYLVRAKLNSKADITMALISRTNWNLECWFCGGRKTRTRGTAVGGERSHRCAIPTSPHKHKSFESAYVQSSNLRMLIFTLISTIV